MKGLCNKLRARVLRAYIRFVVPCLRRLPVSSTLLGPVKGIYPQLPEWPAIHEVSHIPHSLGHDHWIYVHHPGSTVCVARPVAAIPELPDSFAAHSVYESLPIYVAHLHWGRVATKNFDVISPDDRVFGDLYHSSDGKVTTLSLIYPRLPRLKKVPGVYATIIANRKPNNYYHWMIDYLTRLWPLENGGVTDYKLLVPAKMTPFQRQSLQLLGFSEDRLVPFAQDHWEIESLLIPSLAQAYRFLPQACQWLQTKLLSTLDGLEDSSPKKLFISRQLASKRRLLNEDQLWELLLGPAGFVRVFPETMTVADQARLFHGADVVVSPHGAGLTNILFMRRDTLVIELAPALRAKPEYYLLSSALKVRYACVTNATERAVRLAGRVPDADFSVPVEHLDTVMSLLELK